MADDRVLTPVEVAALVSVARLGDESYGVTVREEMEARTGRSASIAAVYAALERLESWGYVESTLSDPLPERGGRARRCFGITVSGTAALSRERAASRRLWEGVELNPGTGRR